MWKVGVNRTSACEVAAQLVGCLVLMALGLLIPSLRGTLGEYLAVALLLIAVFAAIALIDLLVATVRVARMGGVAAGSGPAAGHEVGSGARRTRHQRSARSLCADVGD